MKDDNTVVLESKMKYYTNLILLTKRRLFEYHFDPQPLHSRLQAYKDIVTLLEHALRTKNYARLQRKAFERYQKAEIHYKKETYADFLVMVSTIELPIEPEIVFTEAQRVEIQNARARAFNLPATLELWQWEKTIQYFHGFCAYCQHYPFTRMEHFVPIKHNGGTTWDNCVPACWRCDKKKKWYNPDHANRIPQADIERVRSYLLTRLL